MATFKNVIQPPVGDVSDKDHPLKGVWRKDFFKNDLPIILELGCGKGEYTVGLATRFTENNYIGIDIKGARIWRGAKTAHEANLQNVAFVRTRIEFINSFFGVDEVDEIWITFPDPHPGGKNSNKRLTSPRFLNSYRNFLGNNGIVHLKTDNSELFEYTRKVALKNKLETIFVTDDLYSGSSDFSSVFSGSVSVKNNQEENNSSPEDILSIRTHYENIFLNKGMKINYISFRLNKELPIDDPLRKAKDEQ